MTAAHHDEIFVPRPVLVGLVALCLFAIVAIGVARASGVGVTREDDAAAARVVAFTIPLARIGVGEPARALVATRADGARVTLAPEGGQVFARLILQGVAVVRARDGVAGSPPLLLRVAPDGERLLVDPATRRTLRLAAFGRENGASFDELLAPGPASPAEPLQ